MERTEKKRTRNTFKKTRSTLFAQSYAGYSLCTFIRTKYNLYDEMTRSRQDQQFSSKKTIPEISTLARVLNLDFQLLWQFIVLNKKRRLVQRLKTDTEIKSYLEAEKEMITLAVARLDKENPINEDYKRATLSSAIERAAGNNLKDIDDDIVFEQRLEELQEKYIRRYYEIACEYKLPTPRILAFILRLITPKNH